MSKKQRRRPTVLASETGNQFLRGFIATGLLAAMPAPVGRHPLHLALRGAIAIAAGTAGSNALAHKRPAGALMATAVGACSLILTDRLFSRTSTDQKDSANE